VCSRHVTIIGEFKHIRFLDVLLAYHILGVINIFLTSKKVTCVDVYKCDLLTLLQQ